MFSLPRAPVSAVGTAFVSCRHICLIIMSHSLIFCFVSQINLIDCWLILIITQAKVGDLTLNAIAVQVTDKIGITSG